MENSLGHRENRRETLLIEADKNFASEKRDKRDLHYVDTLTSTFDDVFLLTEGAFFMSLPEVQVY